MPDAPSPITSTPRVPGQPYDALAPGKAEDQVATETIYDALGGPGAGEPWPKIQEAGRADMATGRVTGGWPSDGTSDGSAWKQC